MSSQEAPCVSAGADAFICLCGECGKTGGQACTQIPHIPAELKRRPASGAKYEVDVLRRVPHLCWCCSPGYIRERRPRSPQEASRPAGPPTSGGRPSQRRCPCPPPAASAVPRPGAISGRPQAARPPTPRNCRMCTGLQGSNSAGSGSGMALGLEPGAARCAAAADRSIISALQILLHMWAQSLSCRGLWRRAL